MLMTGAVLLSMAYCKALATPLAPPFTKTIVAFLATAPAHSTSVLASSISSETTPGGVAPGINTTWSEFGGSPAALRNAEISLLAPLWLL